jgi:predicted dehydrogenase
MTILNTAVIGTGGRARAHLAVIPKLSDRYRLVAVCDIDEERAKTVADEMGVPAYTDVEEMLDRESVDVGLIAVQAEGHHPLARLLAERKVHIVTETPIALTVPCADAMIQAARENGVLLEVSENARKWPHERLKQKIVASGLLGPIREFYLSYTSGSYHGMGAVRALLPGEAQQVVGEFPGEEKVRERAEIEWANGVRGRYEYNRERGNYWEIVGSQGALRGGELHLCEGDRRLGILTETAGEGAEKTVTRAYVQTEPEVAWENPWPAYALAGPDAVAVADAWCSLYNGVVHGKPLDYPGENARKDVELLMAIRESASQGGAAVALPLSGMTDHERLIHAEFEKAYGIDMLALTPEHLRRQYTLPERLRDVMYWGYRA